MPITTSFGKICPKNVVSGNSGLWYESFGACGRTSRDSDNKIIRYVNTHRSWSVCQKPKQSIVKTFRDSFFISDGYNFVPNKNCIGDSIKRYRALKDAKAACVNNEECGCIHDVWCDGNYWILYKGYGLSSSGSGTCAWTKNKS